MDTAVYILNRAGNRVRELPLASIGEISWSRRSDGEASFTLASDDPGAPEILTWRHEVQMFLDGNLRWWGVIWDKRGKPGIIEYHAEELMTLLSKRAITTTSLTLTSIEQTEIAWALVEYAQTPQGSESDTKDLNILKHPDFPDTGHNRSREYRREDHQFIFDLLQEFYDLDDGFDYAIEYDASNLRVFQAYYPARGHYKPELALEYGRNISDFTFTTTSKTQFNDGYNPGGSAGDVRFEGHVTDAGGEAEWGLMTEVWSEGSQLDPDWLEAKCAKRVRASRYPQNTVDIESVTVPVNFLDVIEPGDRIRVLIDDYANYFNGFAIVDQVKFNPSQEDEIKLELIVIEDVSVDPIMSQYWDEDEEVLHLPGTHVEY